MKKSLKTFFAAFLSVLAFSLLSCNDVIFADIRNEVKLDDPTVSGSIMSIVRYKDYIFTANGRIYYQSKDTTSTGNWKKFNLPNSTVRSLAADETYLYALSLSFTEDDDGYNVGDEYTLYRCEWSGDETEDGVWETLLTVDYPGTAFFIFCTNTPIESNRYAFFRNNDELYKLSGNIPTGCTGTDGWDSYLVSDGDYSIFSYNSSSYGTENVYSATYLDGEVILSPYRASTSNETESADATCVYTADSDDIYYSTDNTSWQCIDTDSDSIISMGFTQDFMLLGTSKGVQHVTISSNVPGSSVQDFDNNAASALSSYYEVPALLVVNPGANEYSTAIFAAAEFSGSSSSTSATLDNVGLWGYYPSEDEWNRE